MDVALILSIYGAVASTYILYVLWRKGVIGEQEMKELLAVTLAIIKALNHSGMISQKDLWTITESIYLKVMLGKKASVYALVNELYKKITETVIKETTKEKPKEEKPAEQQQAEQPTPRS